MKSKIKNGTIVNFSNAAFLSEADFEMLASKNANVTTEEFWEQGLEVTETIVNELAEFGIEILEDDEVYIDAVTNLNDMTVTVNAIYNGTYGTYGIIVHDEIATTCLPLTIALPQATSQLLSQYK